MARKRRQPEEEEAVLGDDPGRPLSYCCGGLDADVVLVRSLCSEDLRGVHRVGLLHLLVRTWRSHGRWRKRWEKKRK